MMKQESFELIDQAVNGDKEALQKILVSVQDMIYNLSLRMLGSPHDAEELKLSCTNVMLQCLTPESRCIYVLGIMFKADSKVCGEILGITPDAYRQRLSRIRKKVSEFLSEYCGLSKTGVCNCQKRVGFAIQTHRLNPQNLEYSNLEKLSESETLGFVQAMEEMDELSLIFANLPKYRLPGDTKAFIERLISSNNMDIIKAEV